MKWVTGPYAPPAPTENEQQALAACLKGRAHGGETPLTEARGALRECHPAAPTGATPARKSLRCAVGDRPPRPHPQSQRVAGRGRRPRAPRTEGRGIESAQPWTSLPKARGTPPRATSCCLRSAQRRIA